MIVYRFVLLKFVVLSIEDSADSILLILILTNCSGKILLNHLLTYSLGLPEVLFRITFFFPRKQSNNFIISSPLGSWWCGRRQYWLFTYCFYIFFHLWGNRWIACRQHQPRSSRAHFRFLWVFLTLNWSKTKQGLRNVFWGNSIIHFLPFTSPQNK